MLLQKVSGTEKMKSTWEAYPIRKKYDFCIYMY